MSSDFNRKAEAFLRSLRFRCEPEPDWITAGRKPDFFCTGPLDLWIEVKSLAPPGENERVTLVSDHLLQYQDRVLARGRAFAFISDAATQKHAKAVLNLARHALTKFDLTNFVTAVIVVPEDPVLSVRLHMDYMAENGRILLVTYKSGSGRYGYPYSALPKPYHQEVVLSGNSSNTVNQLDRIANPDRFLVALQVDRFEDEPFRIAMLARSGIARPLGTSEQIRSAIQDANRQLKNGLQYRDAPTALFLYQDGALVPDDIGVLAALFGDLNYIFPRNNFGEGRLEFGKNGALRGQHSSVSAIVYFRNEGIPLTVHNPWAVRSLPRGIFGHREYVPLSDGTMELIE